MKEEKYVYLKNNNKVFFKKGKSNSIIYKRKNL